MSDFSSYFIINNIQRVLEFATNRMATEIFCVSTHLKNEISSRGHISKNKIDVIFNKVELEKSSKPYTLERAQLVKKYGLKNKKVFLFIGRFVWQKNIFTMLKAFKEICEKHDDAVLLMVSDGPLRKDVEQFISENSLDGKVKLLGFVSNDLLPALFKISDAFILPSVYEGFGIVLIEAQAAGCPIIVSDIPSVKDIVDKKNSWTFEPMDEKKLASYMEMFFDAASINRKNRKDITTKRKQGLIDVKRFEWNTLAEHEIELYKEILSKK